MSIYMLGIDYHKASVDTRALFSFTRKNAGKAMEEFRQEEGISGCIILSTCNRMEIWVSTAEEWSGALYDRLCGIKGIDARLYQNYFTLRNDKEAVKHLFDLAAGLESQILGEEQILTQVKEALSLSREYFCTDSVLEVLFRSAITAGKRVKTEVIFPKGNASVIHQAIIRLKAQGFDVKGKRCMVIGNGEMGKVAAHSLTEAGAFVTVTVRQYRSGMVNIPKGCQRINYGERITHLTQCDLVVSATSSPNYTLTKELLEGLNFSGGLLLIDLAVPRDIEPLIGQLPGINLLDIDYFKIDEKPKELEYHLIKAKFIIKERMDEFYSWLAGRDIIPRIQEIRADAVRDLNLRILKVFNRTPMEEPERQKLLETIETAAGKVVDKMIFGLRDTLEQDTFLECVEGLEKLYGE